MVRTAGANRAGYHSSGYQFSYHGKRLFSLAAERKVSTQVATVLQCFFSSRTPICESNSTLNEARHPFEYQVSACRNRHSV